jgi:Ser/Thr protein kinase RdoA (MazF antagonist)
MPRAISPEHVTREQAQDVVSAAGIEAHVTAMAPLGQGVKSVVSRVELEGAEPLALKVFLRGGHTTREHSAYRLLGEHSLPMPRMLHGIAESEDFPFGCTLMTMAPGEPLNLNFGGLERGRLLEVYRGVGQLQAALHRTAGLGFSDLGGAPVDRDNAEFMAKRIDFALGTFLAHGGSPRLAGKVEAYFDAAANGFAQSAASVLCHGDLHPENIFVSGDSETLSFMGAIDLEEAFTGDAVMDLTRTIQTCPLPGPDLTAALLDGYGGRPEGFDVLHDPYFVLFELELWNFYAQGGSRKPLRSIAKRIRKRIRR